MDTRERVLDLTMFTRRNFAGKFRMRYIFDWAGDYWEKGEKLVKIRLARDEYKDLMEDIECNNIYVMKARLSELETVDAGFGPIEIESV